MTTSVLLNQMGELNEYDLQVLRDYALEAPKPWRNALNELIAARERDWVAEDLEEERDELLAEQKKAVEKLQELVLLLGHHEIHAQNIVDGRVGNPLEALKKNATTAAKLCERCEEVLAMLLPPGTAPLVAPPETKK